MPTYYCGAKDCLGHWHPNHKCDPRFVTRKLYIYTFYNAPLKNAFYIYSFNAVEIWKKANIQFRLEFRPVGIVQACRLLGEDPGNPGSPQKLGVAWGPLDKYDEPGYTQRINLFRFKRGPGALAVFFADTTRTAADPYNFQVYIGNDVYGAWPGRTVAHEIGHLLLGGGHTGDKGCLWKSGLMIVGNKSSAVDIDDDDAEKARERARKIPVS